jgi:hypothetical protein
MFYNETGLVEIHNDKVIDDGDSHLKVKFLRGCWRNQGWSRNPSVLKE